jgi:hypothetical protein
VEALPVEPAGARAASRHRLRPVPRDEARQRCGRRDAAPGVFPPEGTVARRGPWQALAVPDSLGPPESAFALNRRLFKAYYLKEQIERLWSYTYEGAARRFFDAWVRSLRWQRLPAFKKLAGTLQRHLEGILSYCRHKVPFGVVEAINANIRSVIRRGRGYRDHEYLILKVQKSTAQARLSRAAA